MGPEWAREFALLTSSQMLRMLLVLGPTLRTPAPSHGGQALVPTCPATRPVACCAAEECLCSRSSKTRKIKKDRGSSVLAAWRSADCFGDMCSQASNVPIRQMNTSSGATEMPVLGMAWRMCQVGTMWALPLSTLLFVICSAPRLLELVAPARCSFFLERL